MTLEIKEKKPIDALAMGKIIELEICNKMSFEMKDYFQEIRERNKYLQLRKHFMLYKRNV